MVKDKLVENNEAIIYYELTGPFVSMADCKVKIVDNQWFLAYGDEKWTETTELALKSMNYILKSKKSIRICTTMVEQLGMCSGKRSRN